MRFFTVHNLLHWSNYSDFVPAACAIPRLRFVLRVFDIVVCVDALCFSNVNLVICTWVSETLLQRLEDPVFEFVVRFWKFFIL